MTGQELLERLTKLTADQLKLPVVHIHTEYNSPEDSWGLEVETDINSVHVCTKHIRVR